MSGIQPGGYIDCVKYFIQLSITGVVIFVSNIYSGLYLRHLVVDLSSAMLELGFSDRLAYVTN